MREVLLDITPFVEKVSLHQYLKEQLEFSFYYGANLDALFDELTSVTDGLNILFRFPSHPQGKMVEYIPRILAVLEDAARENYHLNVAMQEV